MAAQKKTSSSAMAQWQSALALEKEQQFPLPSGATESAQEVSDSSPYDTIDDMVDSAPQGPGRTGDNLRPGLSSSLGRGQTLESGLMSRPRANSDFCLGGIHRRFHVSGSGMNPSAGTRITIDVWYSTDGLPMINHLNKKFATHIPPVHMVQHCITEMNKKEAADNAYDGVVGAANHMLIFTPMVVEYLRQTSAVTFRSNGFPPATCVLVLWAGELADLDGTPVGHNLALWHRVDPEDDRQPDFIERIKRIMTPSRLQRKGGFTLYPATLACGANGEYPEIAIIINDELLPRIFGRDLHAKVATKTQSWLFNMERIKEGVYTFKPDLPECFFEEQPYMVHVRFQDGTLGSRRLAVLPQCATLNPIHYVSDAFLLKHDVEEVDAKLAQLFSRNLPADALTAIFEEGSPDAGRHVDKELPSLLHFCARFNLKQLLNQLLTCPGVEQLLEVYNRHGQNPVDLAASRGYEDIASVLEGYQTYSTNYRNLRQFVNHGGYVQPFPSDSGTTCTYNPSQSGEEARYMAMSGRPVSPNPPEEATYLPMDRRAKPREQSARGQSATQGWTRSMSERQDNRRNRRSMEGRRALTEEEAEHNQVMGADASSPSELMNLSNRGKELLESVRGGELTTSQAVSVFHCFQSKAHYFQSSSLQQKQELFKELNTQFKPVERVVNRRPLGPKSPTGEAKSNNAVRNYRVQQARELALDHGGAERPASKDSSYGSDMELLPEEGPVQGDSEGAETPAPPPVRPRVPLPTTAGRANRAPVPLPPLALSPGGAGRQEVTLSPMDPMYSGASGDMSPPLDMAPPAPSRPSPRTGRNIAQELEEKLNRHILS